MKKFIVTVLICGVAFGCYYYLKHKNRFIYEIPIAPGTVSASSNGGDFDSLLVEYNKLSDDMDMLIESSRRSDDEIAQLKQKNSQLTLENARLRGIQEERRISISTTKKTQKNESSNKKELPIARNADTDTLDGFFKQRYGAR